MKTDTSSGQFTNKRHMDLLCTITGERTSTSTVMSDDVFNGIDAKEAVTLKLI